GPVLHDPARRLLRGALQQRGGVGAHAAVQRHVVRPPQHVDRIDLQHPGARERAREGAQRRRGVAPVGEALRGQRDAACLRTVQCKTHDHSWAETLATLCRGCFPPLCHNVWDSLPRSRPSMSAEISTPHVFDATTAGFETEVLQKSLEVPVLVDFWAEWCGPCKTLGPILEKLAGEYHGAFLLAKVDTEKEPQIAGAFQIRSIPT